MKETPRNPGHDQPRRGRAIGPTLGLLVATAIALLAAPAAWWTTDLLESNDDFCNSCHLPNSTPLHEKIRHDFDARPPASLAARHADRSWPEKPASPKIRCIDCHGGVGFLGRARIKLLSAKDSFLYLTGQFDEPREMSWPLWDADCRQCHTKFQTKSEGFDGDAFHGREAHDTGLGVDCVACHTAHDATVDPDLWFLKADRLRLRCAQCHVEYAVP